MPQSMLAARVHSSFALAILAVSILVAFWGTFSGIFDKWSSLRGFYSHGLLICCVLVFYAWKERSFFYAERSVPEIPRMLAKWVPWFSFIGLVVCGAIWFVGWGATLLVLQYLAVVGVIWCALGLVFGQNVLIRSVPYVLTVAFCVPIWSPIVPFLQDFSTSIVSALLRAIDLPIYVEGNTIFATFGIFEVEGGCSGLGFLLTSACLFGLLSITEKPKLKVAIMSLVALLVTALIVNWTRIFLIILSADWFGIDNPIVRDHVWFGWVVYLIIAIPIFLKIQSYVMASHGQDQISDADSLPSQQQKISIMRLMIALCGLAAAPLLAAGLATAADTGVTPKSISWSGNYSIDGAESDWSPEFIGASSETRYTLIGTDDARVSYYEAWYAKQSHEGEVVSIGNNLAGASWRMRQPIVVEKQLANVSLPLNESVLTKENSPDRRLIWYWYDIGEHHVASHSMIKAKQISQLLRGRRDAKLTAISTACTPADCNRAREVLTDLLLNSHPNNDA